MNTLQQAKYDLVVESVKPIMLEKGIHSLKISDIAKAIKVGEATIYRYFGTKTNLVIQVGTSLWKDIYLELMKLPKTMTGYQAVENFFNFFLEGYKTHKEVFVFLDEFDSHMVKEQVSQETLREYDNALGKIKKIYDEFFQTGVLDKSIQSSIDKEEYYYTTTHMILGVCKRLATSGNIVPSDEIVKDIVQIDMALKICMQFIKKESEK